MEYKLSGTVIDDTYVSARYYPTAVFDYTVHIPECCDGKNDCGLILTHDGLNRADAYAGIQTMGSFHVETDFTNPGVFDMLVTDTDAVFVSTELGIQCMRSFGIVDVIIRLPEDAVAEAVDIDENGVIYALVGGKAYERQLSDVKACYPASPTQPRHIDYYD